MNKLILLIILLVCEFCGYSQLTFKKVRDTSWYVELKDSTVLYSKKLWVKYSLDEGEYLLLDYNKKVPMSAVARYRSRTGEYIREKGPEETYRIEKGGPRLFVYSRSFYYSDSTGYHNDKDYFFRKGATGDMQKMSYKNLMDAMADNAASIRELQASRSTMQIAGIAGAAGFLFTVIGAVSSFKQATSAANAGQQPAPPGRPGFPGFPGLPSPPGQPAKRSVSPLLIAGPVIMVGAMVALFTAPGHIEKAIKIYNQ